MSRARSSFQIKLLPIALIAAFGMLGSTMVASAQSYDQGSPSDQSAPQYESAQTDPSGRVARLAYLSGDVEFAPAGENDFGSADVNRPLTTGDRLLTGDDGRAAVELGGAALRIDHGSAFNFLDLNDNAAQVELSQGTLNLRVQDAGQNQTYEIDTPAVAFVASQPGMYRVDVAPGGDGAMVTVFDGAGTVYGENGASRQVAAGQSYRFDDPSLSNVEASGLPSPDDFDRWAQSRDDRRQNSVSSRYVSPEVVGYDDLDDYGAWNDTPDYGNVWFPTQVSAGWAPYRDGHWAWIEPWGWTWVDDAPWGYAPFHYGRWVYVHSRWGWCPGPRQYRPVYAPALVAFVGGSGFSVSINIGGGGPVGWFPLGPRDIYMPPYRASRNYFTNVNVTNIRNVYVNKTVINNYYGNYAAQRPMNEARYAYRNDPRALTAVPRNVFTGAKPVRNAVLHVPPRALTQAQVMPRPHVSPTQASLAIRQPKRPIAMPARAFDRKVVAKRAPPPRPVPFAARERVIAKQGGAPIPTAQLQQMRKQHAQVKQPSQRVQVVAAQPKASKPLPPVKRVQDFSPRPGNAPAARKQGQAPVRAPEPKADRNPQGQSHGTPTRTPERPATRAAPAPRAAPLRPGELPSARFAHPDRNAPSAAERNAANREQQGARTGREQAQSRTQQTHQHTVQAQQDKQEAEQARVRQQQAQERETQARQHDRAQQEQQRAQRDQQHAAQARQQQEAEHREAQSRQRDQQTRAQQEQEQEQQRARQQQQRADDARQQRDAQQREAQARQHDEQARAQKAQMQQQRAEQTQVQQQRAQQAQMMQQRQAQQRAEQTRAQQQQHAPPPHHQNPPPPKKKDHDDNGH